MSCQEIPDQLQEKLSLGLLGWETVVRLDWELDQSVPEVSICQGCKRSGGTL